MNKRINKVKIRSLMIEKITNMSIPYLEEYKDKVVGIYLSPYKFDENKHIEIVVVNDKEELPILAQETSVKNTRIYLSVCDISNYTLKETMFPDYKYIKDLKSGFIIYDPNNELKSKQNQLNKSENIKYFFNRDVLATKIIEEVKTKLMTR